MFTRVLQTDAEKKRILTKLNDNMASAFALSLAFTRYCFTLKLYCGSQSSFHCPPLLQSLPYCNTIARPMRNIRSPIDLPPLLPCTIQYW